VVIEAQVISRITNRCIAQKARWLRIQGISRSVDHYATEVPWYVIIGEIANTLILKVKVYGKV
jgi:type VI protein secretion system component VasK